MRGFPVRTVQTKGRLLDMRSWELSSGLLEGFCIGSDDDQIGYQEYFAGVL